MADAADIVLVDSNRFDITPLVFFGSATRRNKNRTQRKCLSTLAATRKNIYSWGVNWTASGDDSTYSEGASSPLQPETIDDTINSPLLTISRTGILVSANSASWIVLAQWHCFVGDVIPEPWNTISKEALETNTIRTTVLSNGVISTDLFFFPNQGQKTVVVAGAETTADRQSERERLINATIYMQSSEAIVVMDADFRTINLNPAYTKATGYREQDALGEMPVFLQVATKDSGVRHDILTSLTVDGVWQGEIEAGNETESDQAFHVSISAIRLYGQEITHYLALIRDVTFRRKTEEQLQKMAHYDSVTGLPNRYLFSDRVQTAINDCRRSGERLALLILDLDGFKSVNDTFGHHVGDELLRKVGNDMVDVVRTNDTVARLGGDEFAVVARDIQSNQSIEIVAGKLNKAVSREVRVEGFDVFVTCSIGIAVFPDDGTEAEILIRRADAAMYRVKTAGKNDYSYAKSDHQETIARALKLQTSLRRGIGNDAIRLVYQPQISTTTNRLVGLEALARWKAPEFGEVSPRVFVEIAEKHGLIHQLGETILSQACTQGVAWLTETRKDIPVSVNVSARQLKRRDFIPMLYRILNETGFPPELLELEITESVFMDSPDEMVATLGELASRGINCSIDNFGTQYASLMYIKRYPIRTIKIDQSFIRDIPEDESSNRIASAIIAMGNSLHCRVVAEGVETAHQYAYLKEQGCPIVQGFYTGIPMEPGQIREQYLQRHQ